MFRQYRNNRRGVIALLVCALPVAIGCGQAKKPLGVVAGHFTIAGKPISFGTVVFQNSNGLGSTATLYEDGSYQIKTYKETGVVPGKYLVAIRPDVVVKVDRMAGPIMPRRQPTATASPIPQRYQSVATSGLTAEVKEGDNPPFNFDLKP
jgi:hypothetical protein